MHEPVTSEPIKLYLDDDTEPFKVAHPPLTFQFNTIALADGPHVLRIEASNGLAPPTVKEIPFVVRNGVAITVSGLDREQTIAGQVQMVINAYAGNTEVDFEPRRAETPQPVPTWAWVVLLAVVAWTMFYVLNPQVRSPLEARATPELPHAGLRIFQDACARCHGETAKGHPPGVPSLRDAAIALAETPAPLLTKVVTSTPGSMMPAWGTRLTNDELIAVVNHVRRSWGHHGSPIQLSHPKPPKGIEALQRAFVLALKDRDARALVDCCVPAGDLEPQLFRTDGVDARGTAAVAGTWRAYLQELERAGARVVQVSFPDDRYDYDPVTVEREGSVVIGAGRIFLETKTDDGRRARAKGRFLHVYERRADGWALVFDFADIPMAIGCLPGAPDRICVAGDEALAAAPPYRDTPDAGDASGVGYARVQAWLQDLGRDARSAPHENFWELDYDAFVRLRFPEDWATPENTIRLLVPYDARASNLIRALRGEPIRVDLADGNRTLRRDIPRMPKGAPPMPADRIRALAAWIDRGCPEFPDRPSALPRPPAAGEAGAGAAVDAPPDPFATGDPDRPAAPPPGFPQPGAGARPPAFPPPAAAASDVPPRFPPPTAGRPVAPPPEGGGGEADPPPVPPPFPPPTSGDTGPQGPPVLPPPIEPDEATDG